MITDKQQLVADCQRRDPKAMRQLYDELAPAMLGVCMRYTGSRDEAQDLLHDGFIKVYEGIGDLQNAESLESWVYHIMVSVSVNYIKRNSEVVYYDTDIMEDMPSECDDEEFDLDYLSQKVEEVIEIMQKLPKKCRAVFNLRAVEELNYDEIAVRMHMSEVAVRAHMSRARQLIIEKLNMKMI